MDAPLSPAFCLVFSFCFFLFFTPLIFILMRVYWKQNANSIRTERGEWGWGVTQEEKRGDWWCEARGGGGREGGGQKEERGDRERQWLTDYSTLSSLYLFWLDELLDAFCSLNSKIAANQRTEPKSKWKTRRIPLLVSCQQARGEKDVRFGAFWLVYEPKLWLQCSSRIFNVFPVKEILKADFSWNSFQMSSGVMNVLEILDIRVMAVLLSVCNKPLNCFGSVLLAL